MSLKRQNHHRQADHSVRRGTTILEVIIAIGVLLFGLVGLAAIIPAASQLARNSVDFSRGTSIGVSAASNFEASRLNVRGNWMFINDVAAVPVSTPVTALGAPGLAFNVCIDPLFVSRPENFIPTGAPLSSPAALPGRYEPFVGPGTNNSFRRNRFPYYANEYCPLADPSDPTSPSWAAGVTPRLLRCSINQGAGGMVSYSTASSIFDDHNRLQFDQPDDSTLPPSQTFEQTSTAANPFYPASRSARPQYSWFTTIQPTPFDPSTATANIVVVKERDRLFETPATGAPMPDELSERLALVHPGDGAGLIPAPLGFRNGAGGTLHLVGSIAVSPSVRDGDWLMLMKLIGTTPVHAWYRVVQAESDATPVAGYNDPVGSTGAHDVWRRSVTLEGPDWDFINGGPTVAALVDGVVSVVEFPVRLQ